MSVRVQTVVVVASLALAAAAGAGCAGSTASSIGGTGTGGATASGSGGFSGGGTGGSSVSGTGGASAGGTGGTTGSGGSSGTGGASVGCLVTLTPVSATSFDALEAGPNARFRVRADVFGTLTTTPVWTWSVMFGGSPQTTVAVSTIATTSPLQSQIEFPIADAGSYDIQARVSAGVACPMAERIAVVHAPSPATFVFRVTPPAVSDLAIPIQDVRIPLPGPGPFAMTLSLTTGNKILIAPQDSLGQYIPSYVRVSSVSTGSAIEGNTTSGPFTALVLPQFAYDVLVIPDGAVAPQLLSSPPALPSPLAMDPGITVTGSARDGGGVAVSGVHVVLREGARPSTIGASDTAGQFSLVTRAGALSAVIAPPVASGLPEAHIGSSAAIMLDAAAPSVDLAMAWANMPRAPLVLTVTGTDGTTPIAGAEVRLESPAELAAIGTLTVRVPGQAPVSLTATGAVRADVFADGNGVARFPSLPVGSYVVTAAAPQSLPGLAVTSATITLAGAGLTTHLALASPINLTGTLRAPNATSAAAGVRVLARDTTGKLGADTMATVAGTGGAFSVAVAPGRTYQLVADPMIGTPGSPLARTVLTSVDVGAVGVSVGDLTVATAVPFTGTVQVIGRVLGGAVVQVFCAGSSATCVDPTVAVAEAVTASDGTFTVGLPATSP